MWRTLRRWCPRNGGAWLCAGLLLAHDPAMAGYFGTLFAGTQPPGLGTRDGRLLPCPDSPNCVSSQAAAGGHAIAPFAYRGAGAAAMKALADIVRAMPGAKVVTAGPSYVHAEFASDFFGFVDDVEFALDAGTDRIDVRSAARLGYSDFGVNRKRIESIRAAFASAGF